MFPVGKKKGKLLSQAHKCKTIGLFDQVPEQDKQREYWKENAFLKVSLITEQAIKSLCTVIQVLCDKSARG